MAEQTQISKQVDQAMEKAGNTAIAYTMNEISPDLLTTAALPYEEAVVSGALMKCDMAPTEKGWGEYRMLDIGDHDAYLKKLVLLKDENALRTKLALLNDNICTPSCSGIPTAHEHHCAPVKNIPHFRGCKSPRYLKELGNIITYYNTYAKRLQNQIDSQKYGLAASMDADALEAVEKELKAVKDQRKVFETAKSVYEYNLSENGVAQGQCVLALLDTWFDPSSHIL